MVADDWDTVVMDEEMDVMLMLHAGEYGDTPDWMFHELERVASKFNHVDSVVIGSYDVQPNELPHSVSATLIDATASDLPRLVMFSASPERKKNPAVYGDMKTQQLEGKKLEDGSEVQDAAHLDAASILEFVKKTVESVVIDDGGEDDEDEEEDEDSEEEA